MSFFKVKLVIAFGFFLVGSLVVSKFIFPGIILSQSNCNPAAGYTHDCPANQNPEYNIGLYEKEKVAADLQLFNQAHPTDPRAPQLTGLIYNTPYPQIVGAYKLNPIKNFDSPSSWEPVNGIGLGTNPGQIIQLPTSGYDIGNGYQAIIIYADSNNLGIKYTAEDNIVNGYTLYLEGVNVNPQLVSLYNQANLAGRKNLPAIDAQSVLGTASGSEVIAYMRDTGAFMNPFWFNDWWHTVYDDTGVPLPPELLELLNPPPPLPDYQCSVGGAKPPDDILRPKPCEHCSFEVPQPTNACAQQPTIQQKTTWNCSELERCPPQGSDNSSLWIKKVDWGLVSLSVDTTNTKVPFAGYREYLTDEKETNLNLYHYLNDYFEGAYLFDEKPSIDPQNQEAMMKAINEAGVFRKLAPQEVQDNLRKQLIINGLNYKITDGTTVKHMQDWWVGKPDKPKPYPEGRFPPQKPKTNDPDYNLLLEKWRQNYQDWRNTEWGIFWSRIPLFTREDSPGKVQLSIEHAPGELAPADNQPGQALTNYSAEFPMSFPHLARLNQATTSLSDLLLPTINSMRANILGDSQPKKPVLLAQAHVTNPVIDSNPKLLAQGSNQPPEQTWYQVNIVPENVKSLGNNQYEIGWRVSFAQNHDYPNVSAYDMSHFGFNISINGQNIGGPADWGAFSVAMGTSLSNTDLGFPPATITIQPGQNIDLVLNITSGTQWGEASKEDLVDKIFANTCHFENGVLICQNAQIKPDTTSQCKNGSGINKACDANNPQIDINPNDEACCNVSAQVEVPDYRIIAFKGDDNYNKTCNCTPDPSNPDDPCESDKTHSVTMKRQVEVRLKIPYLKKAWEKSTDSAMGFFNIFKPGNWPDFPDSDAQSGITYKLTGSGSTTFDNGQANQDKELYLPYLGGVQQAKKCLSEQFLLPPSLQTTNAYCDFWNEYLGQQPRFDPNQQGGFRISEGKELDGLDCQNTNVPIADSKTYKKTEKYQNIISSVKSLWPHNLLEQQWDYVVTRSVENNWNPACVIGLWIEESGGSDFTTTKAKYSLGCEGARNPDPSQNLIESLDCLFSRKDSNYYKGLEIGSRDWWLVYAEGPNNRGIFDGDQVNFTKNFPYWVKQLSQQTDKSHY